MKEIIKSILRTFFWIVFESFSFFLPIKRQKDLIMRFDWNVLIILDACRYDYFKKVIKKYFLGQLMPVISEGSRTEWWFRKTWGSRFFENIIYFSANPMINSKIRAYGIEAKRNFYKVVDIWLLGWKKDISSVHPFNMNKIVRRFLKNVRGLEKKKIILHYLQPHGPWIGKTRLTICGQKPINIARDATLDGYIIKRIKANLLNNKILKKAYKDNLELVLKELQHIVNFFHKRGIEKIIISSDHGELLGEFGLYLHPNLSLPQLRIVPWFEVSKVKKYFK